MVKGMCSVLRNVLPWSSVGDPICAILGSLPSRELADSEKLKVASLTSTPGGGWAHIH